jgi:hypothetical protein
MQAAAARDLVELQGVVALAAVEMAVEGTKMVLQEL